MVKQPAADTICSKRAGPLKSIKNIWGNCHRRQCLFSCIVQKHWLFFECSGSYKGKPSQTLVIQPKGFPSTT